MGVFRKVMAVAAVGVLAAVTMWRGAALRAQGTRPPAIQSISICSATGGAGKGSCPSGSFDTQQLVLGGETDGHVRLQAAHHGERVAPAVRFGRAGEPSRRI
jgi:hypothetical protein